MATIFCTAELVDIMSYSHAQPSLAGCLIRVMCLFSDPAKADPEIAHLRHQRRVQKEREKEKEQRKKEREEREKQWRENGVGDRAS